MPNYTGCRSNDFVRRDVVTTAMSRSTLLQAGIKQSIHPLHRHAAQFLSSAPVSVRPSGSTAAMKRNHALWLRT